MMGTPEKIIFCGQFGTGLAAKIANNYIAATTKLLVAEGMAIGLRHGVDKDVLYNCIKNSTGNSWVFEHSHPVPGCNPDAPASHNFYPRFKPFMIVKDITLGVDAAIEVGVEPTLGITAIKTYQKAADDPRTKVCPYLISV